MEDKELVEEFKIKFKELQELAKTMCQKILTEISFLKVNQVPYLIIYH